MAFSGRQEVRVRRTALPLVNQPSDDFSCKRLKTNETAFEDALPFRVTERELSSSKVCSLQNFIFTLMIHSNPLGER